MAHTYSAPARWALLLTLAAASAAQAQTPATFAWQTNPPSTGTGSQPQSLVLADVNADGKPDVLTANKGTSTLGVLLGNGLGGFTLQASSPSTGTGSSPYALAVADVNADGKLDVLTANSVSNTLGVLLGNGTGGFTLQANSPATGTGSAHPISVAIADVNADGKPDALVANTVTNTLGVLLGNGLGGFTLQTSSPTTGASGGPNSVAIADVNADGKPDAVVTNTNTSTLAVLLGNGLGGFTLQASSPSTGANTSPNSLAIVDANGDGMLDVLTANPGLYNVGVLLGNGTGSFTLQAGAPSTGLGSGAYGLRAADVNGDGNLDVLTVSPSTNTLSILTGNGAGSFALQSPLLTTGTGSTPYSLAVADVNGDGKRDVITANYGNSTLGVYLNSSAYLASRTALPGSSATLAPNPARSSATLSATGLPATARTLEATLLNPVGQLVRRLTVPTAQGVAQGSVPIAGLAPGLYLLHLSAHDAQGAALGVLPTQRLSVE